MFIITAEPGHTHFFRAVCDALSTTLTVTADGSAAYGVDVHIALDTMHRLSLAHPETTHTLRVIYTTTRSEYEDEVVVAALYTARGGQSAVSQAALAPEIIGKNIIALIGYHMTLADMLREDYFATLSKDDQVHAATWLEPRDFFDTIMTHAVKN